MKVTFEVLTGVPEFVAYVFVFCFGAIIGSFLNVVIHRVPNRESIVLPSSACPKCHAEIRPYDNIPILSWLILAGKCRNCKAPITFRYPAVELLAAILFTFVYWNVGMSIFLPVLLIFVSVMLALIFIDAEHMILPNVITYPLFFGVLILRIAFPLFGFERFFNDFSYAPAVNLTQISPIWVSLLGALLGALVGGGSLWLIGEIWKRLRGIDAMGLGDVKMMLGVGALLGWRLAFLSIFLGAFSGALIGLVMIAKQKDKNLQTQIPFGIFLGIGSIVALLFGDSLVRWYLAQIAAS
jgi:leader peptidase (prepilin peptidase)/N-methyltransferase